MASRLHVGIWDVFFYTHNRLNRLEEKKEKTIRGNKKS